MDAAASCSHCGLPAGRMARRQDVNGEDHWFCCHGCCLAFQFRHGAREAPLAATWLIRLGVGSFLAMNVMLLSLMLYADAFSGDDAWLRGPVHWLQWALATPMLVLLGGPFLATAWRALRQGRLVTDTLVSIGVLGAYGYSVWQLLRGSPLLYFDTATMVLLLFTAGRAIEAQGRARAARSLAPMLAAERAEARVVRGGVAATCPIAQVQAGDLVRVLPGERIAVDAVVVEGRSECEESVLTGQPGPRLKGPGAAVCAGSVNGAGLLLVRATAAGLATRWVLIGRMVREALASRTLVNERIDRIAAAFIPCVLLLALATGWFWHARAGLDAALLAGLAVLVVACPCSLGLAAPLAGMLAIGQAAQRGILVRSGSALEKLAGLRGVAFDKTGTLTGDSLRLAGLRLDGASEAQALWRARSLAFGSDHPLARALQAAAGPQPPLADALQAVPGAGLLGRVDGECCALGSAGWLASLGWELGTLAGEADQGRTTVLVGWDGRARARFEFVALPVAGAGEAVRALQARRLATLLLSGDSAGAVERLARQLGIAHWHAGLVPEAKVALLRDWSARHGPIAMVGDGLNDGPVLAAAAVGIAVGGATDLARESADIVLPRDGLASLPWLLDAAQRLRRSVRANLLWAFGYNAVALGLAASGLLRPVLAAALMAGSSLLVVARSWLAQRRAEAADDAAATPSAAATAAGASLVVLLAVGLACPAWADHAPKQAARGELAGWSLAPFTLTDQAGRPFTDAHLRGRWTFVVLGDTSSCGPPCEAALAALAGLCQRIAPATAMQTTQVLFVSLDPRRDTPARLRAYLAAYDARFVGVTGGASTLGRLADDMGGPAPAAGGEPPHYPGTLVLVGPDAAIRAEYLPPFDVPRLTAAYLRARLGRR